MRKVKFFYYEEDADKARERFIEDRRSRCYEINENHTTVDDRCKIEYQDAKSRNLCWSGEAGGVEVEVYDPLWDTTSEVVVFASWTSKSLE